jgi:hypothetical protein
MVVASGVAATCTTDRALVGVPDPLPSSTGKGRASHDGGGVWRGWRMVRHDACGRCVRGDVSVEKGAADPVSLVH